ncbi:MAG: cation diffusion facilitator CzcD-associated flavoprotein CzcO [Gammaproteobacteria bacterium]|jgi:cation diffusion facilitator CzcD-associated flavoprotein CzcO
MAAQTRSIIIIGAGPGGICAAIKLLTRGFENFIILEKAPALGGTWWYNQYPGAACDVPSHLYSFSFETQYDWSSPYADAAEILTYMQRCADKYGVMPYVRFDSEVNSARWNEQSACWILNTSNGATFEANILIAAQGMFNEPLWPDIPSLDNFAGTMFHTARWDHDQDLRNAQVGMIGSAASAVQSAPPTAVLARHLSIFQRTPNWILPKKDRPYLPEKRDFLRSNPAGIEQNRQRFFEAFDGFELLNDPQRYAETVQLGLDNIAVVNDPTTRARLTPNYPFGCKRILLSSNYYPMFNRDNVSLVTENIKAVNTSGVATVDGSQHDCDVLVIATGFHVSRYLSSVEVFGRARCSLREAWNDGAQAYLGITTHNFPNLFQLYGPNTNKGSILYMLECQTDYIVRQIERMNANDLAWIDVREDVMRAYNDEIQRDANAIEVWSENCNNYFRHPGSGRVVTQYPRSMLRYREDTQKSDGDAYVSDC